ncbi:dienelactone hydrolase family protein [Actinomadura madurae]|uniref:Carboxymethylenebutenolidase n=1 Tax=Actinomadura madurae TaxID=1993 RepID=A0A1I5GMF9_9ACTN|nr:dienelactone hydrolase family protein [Actinomadura madurae]SFO37165.1 carboxymethylenebutenolidase [Actinomadura madurae]SPT51404.1 Carboxymethylenebutenolidase [Actinomadura madurae]
MSEIQADSATAWRSVETADGAMNVYRAVPAGATDTAVIVLQEAFGVNEYIQDVTRRMAGRGHLGCAPDLFHRNGVGVLGYDRHTEAMPLIGAIGVDEIIADVRAVVDGLAVHDGIPAERIAVIGFCFGGRAAFTAATAIGGLAGTVVFYGPGIAAGPHAVLDRADRLDAPILMHVGSEDPTIPADQIAAIDAALARTSVPAEQHVYPGAGHAFACDARPAMYDAGAAALAWDRTFEFFDKHLPRTRAFDQAPSAPDSDATIRHLAR